MNDAFGRVGSVLVLGGGSDIGLETARRLVRERARTVVLAARKPEVLQPAAQDLLDLGAERVELMEFDAGEFERHAGVIDRAFAVDGDIDVAVLAFGVLGEQATAERDPAAAIEIARTNYLGSVSVLIPLAERMRQQGHGTIVLLSSVAAERPRRSNFVYGSSKAGADAFAQGLADRLHGSGVRVLVVRPGFVRSKLTAGLTAPPLATTPSAVADAIADALGRDASTIWVPPALRWVMLGLRALPRSVFRRLEI